MVDAFADAERRVIAALLVDWFRPGERLLGPEEFAAEYNVRVSPRELNAILADLDQRGWILRIEDKVGASAVLKDEGYKGARAAVLRELGSPPSFNVNWETKEVFSEAAPPDWFPMPNLWKWYTLDQQVQPTSLASVRAKKRDWHFIVNAIGVIATVLGVIVAVFFGVRTLGH